MPKYSLTHLTDAALLGNLAALTATDRATTAALLAYIAEVDARRLYLPAAYPSMFAYCVGELHLSEGAASKRIQAARAARRFPRLFEEVASGRLHLTAVRLLAPHLTEDNLDQFVTAATHQRQDEIELWLAKRLAPAAGAAPTELRARLLPVRAPRTLAALPGPGATQADSGLPGILDSHADELPDRHAARHVNPHPSPDTQPVSTQSDPPLFIVRVPIGDATHAKLRHALNLLAHSVPTGDLAEVFDRALDALITTLEKRKAARTDRPAKRKRVPGPRGRSIPAAVRRAVWKRDKGRCTFMSEQGRRCESRRGLEFDHVVPHACGGEATLEGLRLRCRAHNQFEAERVFGPAFMRRKREEAARQSVHDRASGGATAVLASPPPPVEVHACAGSPRHPSRLDRESG